MPAPASSLPERLPAIRAERLVRAFGRRKAVNGVTLSVLAGECLALFGPNGAGKTTLLRIFAGLIKPTSGLAELQGTRLPAAGDARRHIGIVSHHGMLYGALTARENVVFTARLYGLSNPLAAADASLERLRVIDRADTPVRLLSRGLQQRVAIARSVVHEPAVLLLDEPYTGLDEAGAAALTSALRELRDSGSALLLVTHNVYEGLALATHAAMMREGRIERLDATAGVEPAAYAAEYRRLLGVAT